MTRYWRLIPPMLWVLALCLLVSGTALARSLPSGDHPTDPGPGSGQVEPRPPDGGGGGDTDADELGIYRPGGPIGSGSVGAQARAGARAPERLTEPWIWALITWAETIRR